MDKTIEKQIISDVKIKVAKFLYNCQNQRVGSGYRGLYTQNYANLLWQNMRLDKLQRKYIEPACEEMIAEGHLFADKEPERETSIFEKKDIKNRISLTDEGILHYCYKKTIKK